MVDFHLSGVHIETH